MLHYCAGQNFTRKDCIDGVAFEKQYRALCTRIVVKEGKTEIIYLPALLLSSPPLHLILSLEFLAFLGSLLVSACVAPRAAGVSMSPSG